MSITLLASHLKSSLIAWKDKMERRSFLKGVAAILVALSLPVPDIMRTVYAGGGIKNWQLAELLKDTLKDLPRIEFDCRGYEFCRIFERQR